MGWSLRKSLRLLPGVRLNLSRNGPRISAGVPGLRASIDPKGKARIYGGIGPLRYQKSVDVVGQTAPGNRMGKMVESLFRSIFNR